MAVPGFNDEQRRQMVAEAAYFRAEHRGFGGDPLEDWLAAEAEIDARLRQAESERFIEKVEDQFALAGEKLAALKRKLAGMKAEAGAEWQHEAERLARLRESLGQSLETLRRQGGEASQRARRQAERLWEEISDVVHRTSTQRKTRK